MNIVWKLTIFCKVFFQTGNSYAILLKMSVCSKEDDFFLFWEIDMEGMTRFILGILHFRLCKYTGFQVASAGYKIKIYLNIAPACQKMEIIKLECTDYGCPVRKLPSLHGRKSTPTPKFLGTAKAYFVCHISPNFQISLIYAFIGCP